MLNYLVNDMLDLFQIKNGKFKKVEHEYDVHKEIGNLIKIMQAPVTMKSLNLEL